MPQPQIVMQWLRGRGALLGEPASLGRIARAAAECRAMLGLSLPDGARQWLALANGLNWNGLSLFPAEGWRHGPVHLPGLVEVNHRRRFAQALPSWLILGEWDDEWLVHDEGIGSYAVVERSTMMVFDRHRSLTEMVRDSAVRGLASGGMP